MTEEKQHGRSVTVRWTVFTQRSQVIPAVRFLPPTLSPICILTS